jgi:hypothetical protein
MSYTSNYNLNIRLSAIEARLNALVPVPPGYTYDLLSVLGVGNNAGTFDIDMNNNNIDNVVDINGNPVVIDLQTACNNNSGISNFLPANTATITSTNFTNARQLVLNADATPTINMIDNANASHFTTLDIDTISLNGTTTTWADIVSGSASSNTLQEVLNAGNIANIGFQLDAGAGANTQTPTQIVLDAQSLVTPTALASNSLNNVSLIIKDEDQTTSPNFDLTQVSLSKNSLSYTRQVPFGYTAGLGIQLTNPTGAGITHSDNFPTPSPFTIDTNTTLKLKATNTAGFTPYGINIDASTPNIWYDLDPVFGASSRIEITNQGAISSVFTTAQQFGTLTGSTVFLTDAVTQRNATLNQDAVTFASSASPSLNSTHTISSLIFNDVVGATPVFTNVNTSAITINNNNQGFSQMTAGVATIQKVSAGGQANPCLILNNTNATGSVALEVYKSKPTAGTAGDVLFNQSVYGKDSANAKQEYTRITHTIRDPTNGAEDGSIEIGAFVNGAYTNFIQLNANDVPVGEVNIFRPIDFIGGSDANATVKVSGTGSVNLNLDATSSAGTGAIALKTKNGTPGSGGGLLLTGDTLLSGSAGGASGQHLCLTIGGTVYKIALLNP